MRLGDCSGNLNQALIKRLSQHELAVLHLMAPGMTNQKIARQLVMAPGTIKAHAASVYRWLDVAKRTGTIARPRQLSILPWYTTRNNP